MSLTRKTTSTNEYAPLHASEEKAPLPKGFFTLTRKAFAVYCIAALLFAAALTLPLYASYELSFALWLMTFLSAGVLAFLGLCIISFVADALFASSGVSTSTKPDASRARLAFWVSFLIFELVFLFALLSNYPGLCSPDSNAVLSQVVGAEYFSDTNRYEGLTNAHPIFYTFLVWLVFKATAFMGSLYASLFVFMLIQITYVAGVLAYAIAWLVRTGAKREYVIVAAVFIALSPVISSHAIILWKDVPFAATLLLVVLHLTQYRFDKKPAFGRFVTLGLLLLLLSLFRNNGYYVALLMLLVMIAFCSNMRKPLGVVTVVLVVFMSVLQGPVFSALSIEKGHAAESVGIPIQQLAATLAADGQISVDDQAILDDILPLQAWADSYDPSTSNPIKHNELFNDAYLDAHLGEFLGVWARCLPKNFSTYVRAWIGETYGYWQPSYSTYIGMLSSTANDEPAQDLIGLGYKPKTVANALIQLLPALFGLGSLMWFSLTSLALGLSAARGRQQNLRVVVPYLPLIGLMLTLLIAAPIVNDYRYLFALYLVIPFLPQIYALSRRD